MLCVLLQFISSRPNSSDTQHSAHLGSRSSSFSSRVRPAPDHHPVSLHYSSPPQTSYLASEGPMSPVYNMPYSSEHCNGPVQRIEKAPLVKVSRYDYNLMHNLVVFFLLLRQVVVALFASVSNFGFWGNEMHKDKYNIFFHLSLFSQTAGARHRQMSNTSSQFHTATQNWSATANLSRHFMTTPAPPVCTLWRRALHMRR